MTIEEASVNINNPDLITAIKSAIVCTNTKDTYSSGFRNGLRYVIALLTDEEPKYEDAPKQYDTQPRILKPEEFAGTYRYCWLETKKSDGRTACGISDICVGEDGVNYEAQFIGTSDRGKLPHALLGSRWRCWSAEPTEEQRRSVKWE